MKRFNFLFLVFLLIAHQLNARETNTDSIHQVLNKTTDDIARVKILYQLSENAPNDSGILDYAQQALQLSRKIEYKKGIADALNNIGYVYANRGDNAAALELHEQSLKIGEELDDKEGVAITLNNIAYIYHNIGDIPKALSYNERSLKIREQIGDKKGIAYSLNNIGNIFLDQQDFDKALDYFQKSLKLSIDRGDKRETALALSNIGAIYDQQGETGSAIESYEKCLQISEQKGWKHGIATALNNLGSINKRQNNIPGAFEFYRQSLKLYQELSDKPSEVSVLNNISSCYFETKDFDKALSYGNRALELAKELGYPVAIRDVSANQSKINATSGNFERAYQLYILFKQMADSVNNETTREATVKNQMQYEFDKVQAVQNAQIQKQKIIRNGLIAGFAGLLVFSVVIYRQRNNVFKSKRQTDELLLNILPEETAHELKAHGKAKAKNYESVSVMFADFKGFTEISEKLTPDALVAEINYCFSAFDKIIHDHNLEKIKTIGDAYMCAGGLPTANTTHPIDIVKAALTIRSFMLNHLKEKIHLNELTFEIRIGINTGPVVAGIVGLKKFAYDIWGDTVNIASRMESSSEPGKINVSGSTYQLIKNNFKCTFRGKLNAKSKGEIEMYFVEGE